MYSFTPSGVCAQQINFSIKDGTVREVVFSGGCSGNLQGVSRLIEGMKVEQAIAKLRGIACSGNNTSCPDQLALALELGTNNQVG